MVAGGRLLFKIAAGEERGMADMASRVRVTGPLARYSEGFGAALAEGGYAPTSVADQLRLMAHLGRWLAGEGLRPGDLTPVVAERFLLARRAAGYRRVLSARGVAPLMEYLVAAGVIVPVVSPEPPVPGGAVLAGYREYLVSERGLAPSTIRNYLIAARLPAAQDGLRLESVTAGDVTRFVLEQCGRRTGSATILVTGLRSLRRRWRTRCRRWRQRALSRGRSVPARTGCCCGRVIAGRPWGCGITRFWCCWCAWACGSARSPGWNSAISTGGRGRSPPAVRAAARPASRCPPMRARRSRAGCAAAGLAGRAGMSSRRCWPRSAP